MPDKKSVVKEVIPDLSDASIEEFEEQISRETGIDFRDFRSDELGTKIADLIDVFTWIGVLIQVSLVLIPVVLLFFVYVILPPITPVNSFLDVVFILLGVAWAIVTTVAVGISTILWIFVKRLSETTNELLDLHIELLGLTVQAVKECTHLELVRLAIANAVIVLLPLITAAIIAKLSLGKLRFPGTKWIAKKVSSIIVVRICNVVVDKLNIVEDESDMETDEKQVVQKEMETLNSGEDEEKNRSKDGLVRTFAADSLQIVHKFSTNMDSFTDGISKFIVKPFSIVLTVTSVLAFVPPLFLWL